MRIAKAVLYTVFSFLSFKTFCQHKSIYINTNVARTFNHNIYSESGYILPVVVKNRTLYNFALGYKVQRKNGALSQYEILTYSTGHRIGVDKNLFPGTELFSFRSYSLSIGVGYKRLWPILKQFFELNKFKDRLYFGPVFNLTNNIRSSFAYGYDNVISPSNKILTGYGSSYVVTSFAKPNLNLGANLSYRLLRKDAREALTFSSEIQLSLGSIYNVSYRYKYDDIEDLFYIKNRGYSYSFSLSIPLANLK